jgi:hypothetical protein
VIVKHNDAVGIWHSVLKHLNVIREAAEKTPPDWDAAKKSLDWVAATIPKPPRFQRIEPCEATPLMNWREVEIRSDVEHMKVAFEKRHRDALLGAIMSAISSAEKLSRSE